MKNSAYLIGISRYSDHTLKGVPNDLSLIARALQHRNLGKTNINIFEDTHSTKADLHALFARIRAEFENVQHGSRCFIHIGASGALSTNPVGGGIIPSDGDGSDFDTVFPFDALGEYLPDHDKIRVTTVLDV